MYDEQIRTKTTNSNMESRNGGSIEATEQANHPQSATRTPILTSTATTPTSRYVRDFESLFVPIRADQLRNKARSGNLRHCQFRSLCWRYFLKCLPEHFDQWLEYCAKSREQYVSLKAKNLPQDARAKNDITDISEASTTTGAAATKDTNEQEQTTFIAQISKDIDPEQEKKAAKLKELEEEQRFIMAANECDHKNVYKTIERDVIRTFPDMEFFRQTEMQEILTNVLFNFATENSHLSYKQGMHELLAALLYVLHTDYQNCLINHEGGYANETMATLMDIKYLEHDVFHLFSALMKSIETWYQNDDILIIPASSESSTSQTSNGLKNNNRSSSSGNRNQVVSVLGVKLKRISENIVKNFDLELFNHLEALQIAPQIYGIRWMRLLFGREFEFLDLLTIWDAIICDHVPMTLTDYIFASMLVTIREELVNGDYTECLNNLMRHQFKDVQYVIKLALHLRDPENNSRPKSVYKIGGIQKFQSSRNQHPETSSLTKKLSQHSLTAQQLTSGYGRFMSQAVDNVVRDTKNLTANFMSSESRQRFSSGGGGNNMLSNVPGASGGSKKVFLPNINKFVSSIGRNIQDKTPSSNLQASVAMQSSSSYNRNKLYQSPAASSMSASSRSASQNSSKQIDSFKSRSNPTANRQYQQLMQQQQKHRSGDQLLLASSPVKEYEMREMQSSSSNLGDPSIKTPFGITGSRSALNLSTESYDDLHSIVDYCWRLLSEQIDSLQRCLPKEKSLSSEDEIFVALAQLKKVRDVLKGSLRLEDELESPVGGGLSGSGGGGGGGTGTSGVGGSATGGKT